MTYLRRLSLLFILLLTLWVLPSSADAVRKSCSHSWKLVSTTEPTCTASGKKVYKCEKCGEKKTERTDALGHDWSYCTVTKKPTCTEDGLLRCTCSRNASHVKEESMPALGHQWSEWTTRVSPGLTSSGTEERECSRCQAKETRRTAPLIQRKEYDLEISVFPDESAPMRIPADTVSFGDVTLEWTVAAANTGKSDLWIRPEGVETDADRFRLPAGKVTLFPIRPSLSRSDRSLQGGKPQEILFRFYGETEDGQRVYESELFSRQIRILPPDSDQNILPLEINQALLPEADTNTEIHPGDTLRWSVSVTNTGKSALSGVTFQDSLSAESIPLDPLAPGETRTITREYPVIRQDAITGYLCWTGIASLPGSRDQPSSIIQSNPLIVAVSAE